MISTIASVKETDLYIRANKKLEKEALAAILKYREFLERYIGYHPHFLTALKPLPVDENAPPIVKEMFIAAEKAGVGPMAAVAGAIAQFVGNDLRNHSSEIIIENGGDIFINSIKKRFVGIFAGNSPFTGKIALEIQPEQMPLGICTSSGTVGHSLSFGKADAVIALSPSGALADAVATATGNIIQENSDITGGIEFARNIEGLTGIVIIKDSALGVWGDVKISRVA